MDQSGTFNQMLKLIQLKVTKKWELSARNNLTSFSVLKLNTAKIILERLEIQTETSSDHRLSKIDRSVFLNLTPSCYFFGVYMAWFFI